MWISCFFSLPGTEEGWDAVRAEGAGRVHGTKHESTVLPKHCSKPYWSGWPEKMKILHAAGLWLPQPSAL